ncbi:RNA polymerase sigma factor [Urbifossiella limnaea]|uniref:ECF RNA polymerase sigma factor SigE n=1 Tax=Urbifossiella limnaea TaxID=2528023 RepID=A0A517XYP5_9BACT|nr:sigma-70 family RNA polymerase sigma factor [Urbifossiella limnaea]QDU22629.1 ECF RNA polymerase sigma factor SigE [Urbifossiella limnaea]
MPGLLHLLAAAAPAEPDADLLARFVAGRDADAFAELVRRHGPAVLGTCRRLVGRSAADDAFQATFLVLAARAGSVRKAASVGSWLVGVAGRVGRRMRQRDRRPESANAEPACHLPPDSGLLSAELGAVLADEFTRLPDKLRAAAVACLLDGRTQDQAAAALGWSSRTVRRRLDEAKELLRSRLERRGITPAAALAALAATAEAVPASLVGKVTDGATLFLAGGGADLPAAALAHGVLAAMTTTRSAAAAALCVAVLAGLGVGWANDAAPQPEPERIPAPGAKAHPAKEPAAPAAPFVHKTANFEVTAPTAAVARALGEEFERQRKAVAVEWLGKDLPAWKEPVLVGVKAHRTAGWYTGEVRFRGVTGVPYDATVHGGLDALLGVEAPRTAARLVLTTRLGRRLPRWVDSAIEAGYSADPDAAFARSFNHLYDGRSLRLSTLFVGRGEKSDWDVYEAQGHAVVKFLLAHVGVSKANPAPGSRLARLLDGAPEPQRGRVVAFVAAGAEANTAAGWDAAARDVYGFDSVDRMEVAWLDWHRRNAPPKGEPERADPDRIPPPDARRDRTHFRHFGILPSFNVIAPSTDVAHAVGIAAEKHRRELAKRWFGAELPDAADSVTIRVTITAGGSGGATTFTFGEADGKRPPGVKTASMELHGPLDAVLKSVLPHEVTHVVLATHFGRPLPRWADEGIAVLAEADAEQFNHEIRARELLNAGRAIRLDTLFRMTDYPRDQIVTFAQGHSVCRFLLERGATGVRADTPRFARGDKEPALMAFLALGMGENSAASWATAAKEVYGFESLDALEQAWIDSLRAPPRRR